MTSEPALTTTHAAAIVRESLRQVAPDADLDALDDEADLRDRLRLDSLDFENFVVQLSERAGRRIDEDDYPQLTTLSSCVRFLTG